MQSEKFCEVFCSVIALAMVTLVTVQVILRMLNMPLFGIEELLNFPTIWIYFIRSRVLLIPMRI